MDINHIMKRLESSKEYADWRKESPDSTLAHIFYMDDEENKLNVQIGFFNKDKDNITSFLVEPKKIVKMVDSEALKEKGHHIKSIDISKAKLGFEEIMGKAKEFMQKEYPKEKIYKTICVLQNIDEGQVWNLTFITETFKTLNIKVDSASGNIAGHKLFSIRDFGMQV